MPKAITDEGRFVNVFVNQMYGMITAIGLSRSILFDQSDPVAPEEAAFHWFMLAFVVCVILAYRWDWIESIGHSITSTASEVAIDTAILVTLMFLFQCYKEPRHLALALLALGVLDLVWVINYIRQFGQRFHLNASVWIWEKVAAIAIYGAVAGLLARGVMDQFGAVGPWLAGGLAITGFVLVRLACFRQVKKDRRFSFLAAEPGDASAIVRINNSYLDGPSTTGFLLTPMEVGAIEQQICKHSNRFYVAKNKDGVVVGFVQVSDKAGPEVMQNAIWFDSHIKKAYATELTAFIDKVAVAEEFRHDGVGRFLYDSLFRRREFRGRKFCAFVVLKPKANEASLHFHRQTGFIQAAVFHAEEFCGLQDYESLFFFRV